MKILVKNVLLLLVLATATCFANVSMSQIVDKKAVSATSAEKTALEDLCKGKLSSLKTEMSGCKGKTCYLSEKIADGVERIAAENCKNQKVSVESLTVINSLNRADIKHEAVRFACDPDLGGC